MNKILAKIIPYLWMGFFIAIFLVGLVIFSYLLVIAALIGLIIFVIAYIRSKIRAHKHPPSDREQLHQAGRTIDHED